jgi:hypothetical protein
MTKKEYQDGEEPPVDEFESNPESLRDADAITDAEEAFMEGYESGMDEEEEEEEKEKVDEFDI